MFFLKIRHINVQIITIFVRLRKIWSAITERITALNMAHSLGIDHVRDSLTKSMLTLRHISETLFVIMMLFQNRLTYIAQFSPEVPFGFFCDPSLSSDKYSH